MGVALTSDARHRRRATAQLCAGRVVPRGDVWGRDEPPDAPGAPLDLVVQAPVVLREDLDILALLTDTDAIEPVTRAGNEGYALRDVMAYAGVAEACLGAGYDCALLPRARSLERVRLVAMDMDSTLITIECIDEIADLQESSRRSRRSPRARCAARDRLSREP
jgi:hypothetical protein